MKTLKSLTLKYSGFLTEMSATAAAAILWRAVL